MRSMTSAPRRLTALVLGLSLVLGGGASVLAAQSEKSRPTPPATKQTQVIRAETYKKMEASQKSFEAKDYGAAIAALEELKAKQDKLNDYERAMLYNFYAAIYYAQEKVPAAIEAYATVLKQPNLNDGLRDSSLYAMAQLYFISEDYASAIQVLKKWIAVSAEPKSEAYVLIAQASYQSQRYAEAEQYLVTALKMDREKGLTPKENALALLRAIYYERQEYAKAARILEILVASYPNKGSYWQQLAGMRGLLDQQRGRLNVAHAAYRLDFSNSEGEVLNLARLYMMLDIPYPAVQVLSRGFKSGVLKLTAENLQLLAQALSMAKEYRQQIPVLQKLADLSGEAKHYGYLGQAYNELGEWDNAIGAFRSAFKAKNVEKPADLHMQIGMALFNSNKFSEARQHFSAASGSPNQAAAAGQWIKFVDQEIERRQAIHEAQSELQDGPG